MKTYIPRYRQLPRSIAKEYRDGATIEELSIKHKIAAHSIRAGLLFMGVKVRPPGTRLDGKYPRRTKLSDKQVQQILDIDRNQPDIPHTHMGEFFGVSRERIRQICKAAGHVTRREKHFPKYLMKQEQSVARKLERNKYVRRISQAWKSGASLRDLNVLMNREESKSIQYVMSRIVYFRNQYGVKMFPYRRPRHWQLMTPTERADRVTNIIKEWNANGDIHRIQQIFGYASRYSALNSVFRISKMYPDQFLSQNEIVERKIKQQTAKDTVNRKNKT